MNNEKQKPALSGVERIVPELRFPEFKEEWEKDCLGKRGCFIGGGTPSKSNKNFWQGNLPWVSSSDINEDSIHKINISRFITEQALKKSATKIVAENSLLIVSRVGVGKLAVSKKEICTSQDFTNFTPDRDDLVFLGYYLKSKSQLLLSFSQGMAIKGFTKEDISSLELHFPKNPKEQQKIANCLSSLDEVINAETEKRDLLQDHKKGLLQQLFPAEGVALSEAEGRNQPKFRFPEFKSDGDWEEKMISELANRFDNLRKPITASDRIEGTTPYYGANGIQSYIEGYTHNGEFILVAEDGANDLKNYPVQYASGKIWVNNHAHVLQGKIDICNNLFLMYAIQNANIEPYLVGGGRAKLNANIMMKINFLVPELLEQQKIADCLSTVDDLIAAQEQRIEKLQAHKKGLMQQLFPKIER